MVFGLAGGRFWLDPGRSWLPALAIGLAIVWWQLQERSKPNAGVVTSAPGSGHRHERIGPAGTRTTLSLSRLPPGARDPDRRRGVLGVLDATGTVDVNWTIALAGGVVLVGLAVAIGAFFGGVGWLAALGAVMAAALLAVATIDVPLHGQIGDRTEHPSSVQALHDTYRQSIGNLELDLSDLQLPAGRTKVTASVGIGKLTVRVPDSVRIVAKGSVTAGDMWLLGSHDDGWNVDHTVNYIGLNTTADAPTLVLDTSVGLGDLRVTSG